MNIFSNLGKDGRRASKTSITWVEFPKVNWAFIGMAILLEIDIWIKDFL